MSEEKKDGRGGARPGAGRKKSEIKKKEVTICLPPDIIEYIDAHRAQSGQSRSKFICDIIKAKKGDV